ncbi:YhcN/YlaJ family sporulation lipoprotein [Gordoniibacillus kamchatkensis]|uniref:YhcN/YlaJ family sporulation lipoprotein n=1 Tax=Gordoniibacillus kamchatkensis TaxID=1590651 RepID=UPI0006965F7D|nr:YhcN/YlaJ family sporulation lipoprotein [Paenibacillus sp. VKM B-2647]
MAVGLAGCSRQGNYTDNSAINNYAAHRGGAASDTTRAYQTQQLYGPVVHDNNHLYYNQYLSDQLSHMYGVRTAVVMTTDKYAYAAVLLDQSGIGTHGAASSNTRTNNAGTVVGIYNASQPQNDGIRPNEIANSGNGHVTVDNHLQLSRGIKQKLAQKIRYLQPAVRDVYISANPDFINAMTGLAQKSWTGQPLDPFVGDFNKIVTKEFGTAQLIGD